MSSNTSNITYPSKAKTEARKFQAKVAGRNNYPTNSPCEQDEFGRLFVQKGNPAVNEVVKDKK